MGLDELGEAVSSQGSLSGKEGDRRTGEELWGWKREVLVIEEGVTNQRIIWPSKGKKGKEMDYSLDLKKE